MVQRVGYVHLLVFADYQPVRIVEYQLAAGNAFRALAVSACEKFDGSPRVYLRDPLPFVLADVPIALIVEGYSKWLYQPRPFRSSIEGTAAAGHTFDLDGGLCRKDGNEAQYNCGERNSNQSHDS